MGWTSYFTDNFARGTTSAGSAGSTTGVGNGWIDRLGGVWSLSSNVLAGLFNDSNFLGDWLYRPSGENSTTQRAVWTFNASGDATPIVLLRVDPSGDNAYAAWYDYTGTFTLATFIAGTKTTLATGGFSFSSSVSYIIDFSAKPNATSGTDLVAIVYSAAAPATPLATLTVTGDTTSAVQGSLGYGLATVNEFPGSQSVILYNAYSASSMTISPATFGLGVVTPFTITGAGTSWTSSTGVTVSNGTNAFASNVVVSGQVITGTLNPGTAATTLSVGNTSDSNTASASAVSAPTVNIVWHGDSLTYGLETTGAGTTGATRIATALAGVGPIATASNEGIAGQTLSQMIAEIPTTINGLWDGTKAANILLVQGGHNDFYYGATPAQVKSSIQTYVSTALSYHPWKIVWSTEPPADYPGYPATFDSMRDQVNVWLRANWRSIGIAALSDFASDQRMGLDGCEFNETYYYSGDHTHPIDAGAAIWGEYDLAAVQSVIGGSASSSGVNNGSGDFATGGSIDNNASGVFSN
jgi:hypothetical protein